MIWQKFYLLRKIQVMKLEIAVPVKTFKYTETGHIGLIPDMKVLHIQTRGGFYSAGEDQEISIAFVK